jgi:hypothetical protein
MPSPVINLLPGQIGLAFGTWSNPDQTGTISGQAAPTTTTQGSVFAAAASRRSTGARQLTWETRITGSPTSATVNILGSMDGVVWDQLASSTSTSGATGVVANADYRFYSASAVVSGGTSPTLAVLLKID